MAGRSVNILSKPVAADKIVRDNGAPSKRKTAKAAHTVPSTLMRPLRGQIAASVAQGRNFAQTAKAYCCTTAVVTEIYTRAEFGRLSIEVENLRDQVASLLATRKAA